MYDVLKKLQCEVVLAMTFLFFADTIIAQWSYF